MAATSKLLEHPRSRSSTAPNPPRARSMAFYVLYPLLNVVCPPLFLSFCLSSRPRKPEDHHKTDCIGLDAPGASVVTVSNDPNHDNGRVDSFPLTWNSTKNRGMSSTSILPSPAHPSFPLPSFLSFFLPSIIWEHPDEKGLTLPQQRQQHITLKFPWSSAKTTKFFSATTSRN